MSRHQSEHTTQRRFTRASKPRFLWVEELETRDVPAPFTPGDLVIYRVGDGTASLANTGNAVFLDEYTPSGTLVESVPMPTVVSGSNNPLVASGTATSEGLLSRSANGAYILLTGYDSTIPAGSSLPATASATTPRTVGEVNAAASVNTTTILSDFATGNNPRSVASTDGTNLWVGGAAGGVRYTTLGATTSTQLSTTVTNIRGVEIYDGQLYVSDSSGSAVRIGTVGTGTPTTTGQTITNLPGFETSTGSPYAFFFANLSGVGSGPDTLYVAEDTAGGGQIQKYSLVSGNWVATGTATATAIRGLTGEVSGTTVTLYGTTGGSSATGGGTLYTFTDSTGYDGTISGTATSLATAATNTAFRGIAFAPENFTLGPGSLPDSTLNTPYSQTLTATGGVSPTYAITSGTLPTGLTLNSTTGVISGTPTQSGSSSFTVTATDATGVTTSLAYSLNVDIGTTTTVSANLSSPQVYGTPITFTATVTAASGTASPTAGSVNFYDNGTYIGDATSTSGTGSGYSTFAYTTTATQLQVNGGSANTITATYVAGTGFSSSSSSGSGDVSETITPYSLTVSGVTANNKVYDSTTSATLNTGSASLVGVFNGDSVTLGTSGATGAFASKNVANGITVTTTGFTISGAQAGDYSLTQPTTTANITPYGLTVSGVTANNKVYDSTTTANLNTGSASLVGVFSGDTVTLGTSGATGTFASKNVGNGITVMTSGFTIGGAQAGDYTLTQPTTTANITPYGLTVSGVTANNKVYDSTTTATLNTGSASLVGVFSGDTVTLGTSGAVGTFASKDVANGITVTTSGFTIGGAQAGDYSLTQPTTTANITPYGLTVNGVTANNKVYDSTTTATLNTGSASLVGVYNGDTVTLGASGATGTFASKDVANGITVTTTGFTIGGAQAGDYTLTQPTTTANITPYGLTVSGVTANNKVYDSTTTATLNTGSASLVGVFSGDTVTLGTSGAVGTFASKDVANGITVTTSGFTIGGAQAGDYSLTQPTTTANITPYGLTVNGVTANNKVYDSTTTATLNTGSASLVGVYSGDTVTLGTSGAVGTFASKNVANGITVTTSGFTIGGAQAGDYSLTQPTTTANITPYGLTVNGVTANNKVYDSTTTATLNTGSASLVGVYSGDTVTLGTSGATGTFASKNVANGITVTTSGFTIGGAQAGDYTLTQPTTTANITPYGLTVSGVTANNKVYDSTTTATLNTGSATLVGVYSGDTVTLGTSGAIGTFASKDVANGITVTTTGFTISGAQAGDYTLTQPTTTANITPYGLTVSGVTANNKVYDSTTTATLNTGSASLVGVFSGNTVTLGTSGAIGTFASKNVGNGITVTTSGFTIGGAQAGDYSLTQPTTTANITPYGLTVNGVTANNKVYDSTTTATLNTGSASLVGVYSGDTVTLGASGATGTFASKDVANGITVMTTGFTIGGAQAGDYTLTQPTTTANITPYGLTVSGVTANNKVYDSTTTATLNTGSASLVGVFSGDTVTLGTSGAVGTFASKDVANGITVTTSGFTIGGAQAGDYSLTQPTTTANITPYGLTVSGVTANNKIYDSTTTATLNTGSASLVGVFSGDTVTLGTSGAVGTFASKNVGNGITVAATGFTISGAQAGDYTLTQPTTTANITARPLTVTAVTDTKTYDGTTSATAVPVITSGALQGTDSATFLETFDTPNVGTGKTLTPSGTVNDGDSGLDYSYTFVPVNTGVIQPALSSSTAVTTSQAIVTYGTSVTFTATVTATAGSPTGSVEFYDDTTNADLGAGTLQSTSGTTAVWTYMTGPTQLQVTTSPAAQAIRAVFTSSNSIPGSSGDLSGGETITPFALTVTGITASNKVYDQSPSATLNTSNAALVGAFSGDSVTLDTSGATGAFASPNVANGITVTVTGVTIGGSQASDYSLTQPTTTANITAYGLTISGVNANNKVYDSTTTATLNTGGASLVGVFSGDTVTLDTSGASGTFASPDVANGITVTTTGFTIGGAQAGDYALTQPTTTANITPYGLTISGVTANNKVYDSTTTATLNTGSAVLVGVFSGDKVTLGTSGATGMFAGANVANGITVTTNGFTIGGGQASDYSLTQPMTTADITPYGLTISSVTANNKSYDSTTSATLNTGGATLVGVFSGDTVTLGTSGATGTFASKNVANGITVTTTGFTISGAQASDYSLTQPTTTANITPYGLTVSGVTANNKVYDSTTAATLNTVSASLVGVLSGDMVTLDTSGATGTFASKNVANGITVTTAGFTISGAQAGDYSLTQPTTSANISPYGVTVSGVTANNKVYDSTTSATLNTGSATLVGVLSGDMVTLGTSSAIGTFASKDVADGITVTITGFTITGAQAGDYSLTQPTTTADITPYGLTVSGVTANNKVYDSTTTASLNTSGALLVGVFSGDTVTLDTSGASGTFASPDVANGITVTTTGFTISGAQAGDYTLTQPTTTANITPYGLTVSGVTANNKVYDSTTTATLNTGSATLVGVFNGDTVTLSSGGATGTFASPDVAAGITVTVSGLTLGGSQAGDYTLTQPTTTANITPAGLTVTGVTAQNKVYDQSPSATLNTASATLVGVLTGDTVTLSTSGAVGTFVSQNVSNGITVTISGLTISGVSAGNYTLTQPTTTADITPYGLTVSGVTANNKVYDSTTSATLNTASAVLVGVFSGDSVTLSTSGATGTFASKDVGNAITVTASGLMISGGQASDYTLTQPNTTANITPRSLTASGITASNKVYDQSTSATLDNGSASLVGVLGGDTVTLNTSSESGIFASPNVGNGITVTVSGLTLGGVSGGDYTLTQPTTTANITPRSLTIAGIVANNKVYDGTTAATLDTVNATLVGALSGDVVSLSDANVAATFTSQNVGTGITVNITGLALSGSQAIDYTLPSTSSTTANITARLITVTAATNSKTYDGTMSASALPTITAGTLATGDSVTLSETYSTRNVGTGLTLMPLAVIPDGNNYAITYVGNTTGVIIARAITVTASPNSKSLDGTTSAAAVPTITSGSLANGDTADFIEIYDTADAGNGETLTPSGTVDDGNGGHNYVISFVSTANGSILVSSLLGATQFAVGPGTGTGTVVTVYNSNGSVAYTVNPFPGFTGGLRVTVGDFTGDGTEDVAVGTASGVTAEVKVLDPSGNVLFDVTPFGTFTGGLFVAAGNISGNGKDDLVITPDQGGGPRVLIYGDGNFSQIASFYGITDPNFRGGARAAVGDINGDGYADLVVAAGDGGGPRVAAWDGKSIVAGDPTKLFNDFYAFDPSLRNGAYVAVGDVNGDGFGDIIAGAGPGGGPRVTIYNGADLLAGQGSSAGVIANFFSGDSTSRGGVMVASKNLDDDSYADVVTGTGSGGGVVSAYLGKNLLTGNDTPALSFDAYPAAESLPSYLGGVYVG